jgi:transcriptional regulator with XRE-family HTH domain
MANNLKRLRKQREITQEDLADFIGVSFQAVSKWERNEGFPDITILPVIANFFDVSLDELVGMNEIKNQAKFDEIKEQHDKLTSAGKIKEDIDLLREALKIFPNDYYLLAELASSLDFHVDCTDDEKKKNREEAIKISERILEFCTDPVIRSNVQSNMCHALERIGNKKRAIELAEKLPNIYKTKEFTLNKFLERDKQIEECQKAIEKLAWGFFWQIDLLAGKWQHPLVDEHEHYTAEQAIKLYQKIIEIYNIVYDEGDYYFSNCYLQHISEQIAQVYIRIGKVDESITNLEKSAEYAIAYDTLPEMNNHKSLLVNMMTYGKAKTSTNSEKNYTYRLKDWIENSGIYTAILNDERVKNIIAKLNEYAN